MTFVLLIFKFDLWIMTFKIYNHLINFVFELVRFFFLNLSFFEHLINVLVLMHQKIIGSSSHLNSFCDFWEIQFNLFMHILFCFIGVFFTFIDNLLNILLILDYVCYHTNSLLMCIHKVNNNIISERMMHENFLSVIPSNNWNSRQPRNDIKIKI